MAEKKKTLVTVSQWEVFKNRRRILQNPLPFHKENFEKHGDTFLVNIGMGGKVVFTRDAETIKYILQQNHKNYYKSSLQTKDLAKYIGHGILTANGDFWRVHRRMVQPAFHKKKLEGLLQIMYKGIEGELQRIEAGRTFDVFPLMGDLAFQVVARSLFSADDIRDRMRRLQHITGTNQEMLIKEMRQPFKKWWFYLSGQVGRHLGLAKEAREILNAIIQERVDSGDDKDDLLDMLLKARYENGGAMSRKQLIDEVLILFTAGHETTANALSFTLFLLAGHKAVQERLYEEVGKIDFNGDMMAFLNGLRYTRQCVEEAMRLYPPVYVIDRVALETDTVAGHGYKKGTVWLMSIYELHRHKGFWKNPGEFVPERFDATNKKDCSNYYYPFGAGPRMCVGNNFAMYEMLMVVALVVRRYRLATPLENIELNPLISLKPVQVPIKFEPR
ncbi:cytochrome P450 [Pseudozobellia thermophila]|uniref:Cytochrome P450 n=1 Tax=Pseudozobellia thermophila TaxID=192903 RepID=A0A1M6KJG5_9FLAO|nr:cytochrome P450 [Pseudozobellia thermophila]SHJ59087.1 Cytochrome P450 [Pseudozobellia thermophila]